MMRATTLEFSKKILLAVAIVCLVLGFATRGCTGAHSSDSATSTYQDYSVTSEFHDIKWPNSELVKQIPEPESKYGKIQSESTKGFFVYIGQTDIDQYEKYVEACQEKGFTVDYSKGETYFTAKNEAGYSLSLRYDAEESYMTIDLDAPRSEEENTSSTAVSSSSSSAASSEAEAPASEESNSDEPVNGIRPSFKASVDSYEEFFNQYCDFMVKYNSEGNPVSMLADYTKLNAQYLDTIRKFEAMKNEDISPEELQYYSDAMARITQRLSEASLAL